MDPVTQGALGAAAAQSVAQRRQMGAALAIGWLAGMAADLDVLIRSGTDPLLALEFHRHFTHSLFFIPFAGVFCGLIFHAVLGRYTKVSFPRSVMYSSIGYATHGLLDSCTSYGTLLLWPLSNERFAFDYLSIIDPVITIPLICSLVFAKILRSPWFARLGVLWALLYIAFGAYQHGRAIDYVHQLARQRGHEPERVTAKPSFGNLVLWKTIYVADGKFYIDAVRLNISLGDGTRQSRAKLFTGDSIARLELNRDYPWVDSTTQQARDIERFRWFSDNYLAIDKKDRHKIIDVRYSMLPNEIDALWGVRVSRGRHPYSHVEYEITRNTSGKWEKFKQMLFGD